MCVFFVFFLFFVEELVSPTPFLDFPGKRLGLAGKTRFFGLNSLTDQPTGVYFGPLIGGMGAHSYNFFGKWEILVTRKKVDFRRNFGIFFCENGPRYSCQNFIPDGPGGSQYSAIEKLAPTTKIF